MKIGVLIFLSVIVLGSCSKSDVEGDLSGKEYIRGRLFLLDTLTQRVLYDYLPNKTVNLSYGGAPDTINYLFSTKSDEQGYFIFPYLKKDQNYRLYYEEKNGDFYYTAVGNAVAPNDAVTLYAQPSLTKQNGVYYTILDPLGTPMKGAKVCVFSSIAAYNSGSCDGSVYSLTTNEYGKAFKFNVPQGTYYAIASMTLNDTTYTLKDTINVTSVVANHILNLKQNKLVGFKYNVTDSTGGSVSGVNVCVFTSRVLFHQQSCTGAVYQIPVDAQGLAQKLDLPPNKYYLFSQLTINNLTLTAEDSVNVTDKVELGTLVLRKK